MARQFVYFMQGLTKSYPTRKVLDNIRLSFYPDAKIDRKSTRLNSSHRP